MSRTNTNPPKLSEIIDRLGPKLTPEQELRRTVLSCLLFEKTFYESGLSIRDRIVSLCEKVSPEAISKLAIEARTTHNLRHVSLLLCVELAKYKGAIVADTIEIVIQRADELAELLSLYWLDGKKPISNQFKKGVARAFLKFDEYQFAKYNRDTAIKIRDVMFLVHAKPDTPEKAELFKRIAEDTLETPATWEVQLSAAGSNPVAKRAVFHRLLQERKIGDMALLRNLSNMHNLGVLALEMYLFSRDYHRVIPFRFISAAKTCPYYESALEKCFLKKFNIHSQALSQRTPRLNGKTILLVDHSGSMNDALSDKSTVTRFDAACGLAMILREMCEMIEIHSFSNETKEVPSRRGFALRDALVHSNSWGGTNLYSAVEMANNRNFSRDRLIVISDEQSTDHYRGKVKPNYKLAYMINVAPYKKGVSYTDDWVHIDGFSESAANFIVEYEKIGGEQNV